MAITVSGTNIVFNDATTQNTAYPGSSGGGITGLSVYNSPGTFTTPANTTKVYAIVCSGAGGGGTDGNGNGQPGPGIVGAGVYTVTASTPYPITVGGGGSGGSAGNSGGASSFGNLLTANGGNGGSNNNNGSPGTAPLATVSGSTPQQVFSNSLGLGNGTFNPGNGGRVLVYF